MDFLYFSGSGSRLAGGLTILSLEYPRLSQQLILYFEDCITDASGSVAGVWIT